ncbi:adenylyltransferase/sulfurtransferase [Chitinophaga skermanii]|uniref:Molybdopterin-synthase adenylyltransferase n=1 Tax=Chitinophaga skermanii TaxID=331697 RepID=A0A327QJF6_9BACT|nr:HesA/MoeB/ThiF family protein [Chitinophaga skermanii]RAJ04118.1 adenylyltransferase/sulfurtransferase [Chitinophaga skermanii]
MERYTRQTRLAGFGPEKQALLSKGSALVIGAGGLGVPVMQYLVGMGIGKIGIIDMDTVDVSNIHRQILYTTEDKDLPKTDVAYKKLKALNELVEVETYHAYITPENALDVIRPYDVVIDCSDNFGTRYLVNDACVILNKPFVYGAIYQFEGQVSVFNYNGSATYRCLYPEPPMEGEMLNCSDMGVLGILPGIVGCYQANEAIKILCGIGEVLANKLMIIQTLTNDQQMFNYTSIEENHQIKTLQKDYQQSVCEAMRVQEINVETLNQWFEEDRPFQLIDVREEVEWDICHINDSKLIPMNTVPRHLGEIDKFQPVVLICHHGMRSRSVANFLVDEGYKDVYNVTGGIHAWANKIDPAMRQY